MADSLKSAKSSVIRVSRREHSIKRKPSSSLVGSRVKSTIHVSFRTPSEVLPRTAQLSKHHRTVRRTSPKNVIANNHITDHQNDSLPRDVSNSNQHRRRSQDFLADMTNPSHRNKKQKWYQCSALRLCTCILILLIIMIIITLVLALVLIKPKNKLMKTPDGAYLRWNTSGITLFGTSGIRGNASTQFWSPFGIIVDGNGLLYIADRNNHRIKRCDAVQQTCSIVAGQANGVRGYNASDLSGPTYLFIDSNNYLYIADSENQRIQRWPMGATSGQTIAGVTNISGSALNQFRLPYGIALESSTSAMYISDHNNHRIMKYQNGVLSGSIIAGGQGFGTNTSQLYRPAGLHLDSYTNSLIIANFGASNIVRWKLGETDWSIVAGHPNGTFGNTSTLLDHPTNMIFDPIGNMYVADMFNHRIQFFPKDQSDGITIAGVSGIFGSNSTLLYYPVSMALDNQLNLYVTDSFNHRIQKFLRY